MSENKQRVVEIMTLDKIDVVCFINLPKIRGHLTVLSNNCPLRKIYRLLEMSMTFDYSCTH